MKLVQIKNISGNKAARTIAPTVIHLSWNLRYQIQNEVKGFVCQKLQLSEPTHCPY